MMERISIEAEGNVFRIDIAASLEPSKAGDIRKIVENDAGEATVTIGDKRRLRRIEARGLVSPSGARQILNVLAS